MRAKLINEINFDRSGNVKSSMGIGKAKEILEILDDAINGGERSYKYYDIEVKSPEDIRIRYSKDIKRRLEPSEKEFEWILKYYPIDQFEIEDYQNESVYFNQSMKTDTWIIQKNDFHMGSDPERMKVGKQHICSIEKQRKNSRKYAEIMVKALNDQYGKLWIFEFIERREISQ